MEKILNLKTELNTLNGTNTSLYSCFFLVNIYAIITMNESFFKVKLFSANSHKDPNKLVQNHCYYSLCVSSVKLFLSNKTSQLYAGF